VAPFRLLRPPDSSDSVVHRGQRSVVLPPIVSFRRAERARRLGRRSTGTGDPLRVVGSWRVLGGRDPRKRSRDGRAEIRLGVAGGAARPPAKRSYGPRQDYAEGAQAIGRRGGPWCGRKGRGRCSTMAPAAACPPPISGSSRGFHLPPGKPSGRLPRRPDRPAPGGPGERARREAGPSAGGRVGNPLARTAPGRAARSFSRRPGPARDQRECRRRDSASGLPESTDAGYPASRAGR